MGECIVLANVCALKEIKLASALFIFAYSRCINRKLKARVKVSLSQAKLTASARHIKQIGPSFLLNAPYDQCQKKALLVSET